VDACRIAEPGVIMNHVSGRGTAVSAHHTTLPCRI
jgi:hypothetical protein